VADVERAVSLTIRGNSFDIVCGTLHEVVGTSYVVLAINSVGPAGF
jgi:hypothetical protein